MDDASFTSSVSARSVKRDSFAAELERNPQMSASRRQQRTQAFTSNMAHASLERQLVAAQTSKMELETKVRERDIQIERLERDRRWFADREKEEREEKERERLENEEEKQKADADLRSLRNALSTLREQYSDLEDSHSTLSRTSAKNLAAQRSQITTLTHQVSVLSQELEECRRISEERQQAMHEVQEKLDTLEPTETPDAVQAANGDMAIIREELHRQIGYLRSLESANARLDGELRVLRGRHESVEVLREEKRWLELRVRNYEEMRERVVSLEAELEEARKERQNWANEATNFVSPSKTPVSVTQALSTLRMAHARLLEENGVNVALLRQREADLTEAERRATGLEESVNNLEAEIRELKNQVAKRGQKALLVEREIGFLQALVASYTAEEVAQDRDHGKAPRVVDDAKLQRLQELESLLAEYKSTNDMLSEELDALGGPLSRRGQTWEELVEDLERERASRFSLEQALETVNTEVSTQADKIEDLEQTLFELSGDIAAGQHVPPGVRVLSLKQNPVQEWVDLRQAAMNRLRTENDALLERLKELDATAGSAGLSTHKGAGKELVPRESWDLVNKEKQELEGLLEQKEKRIKRLKEVYKAKGEEFRDSIASLLGLKLAFYPNGQVRVTSIYDLEASFIFLPVEGSGHGSAARMHLDSKGDGGPQPQEMEQLLRFWIQEEQCIPGFLASVTVECYDKAKREGTLPLGPVTL